MATNILNSVALGFDEAKKSVYAIMRKVFPKIETSKSTLVNAIVSGISLLYSMMQVFAKLLQDELYVATAKELESLYKLVPFVGIKIFPPTPMRLEASAVPQDTSITVDSDPELYLTGTDPLQEGDGNKFFLRTGSING